MPARIILLILFAIIQPPQGAPVPASPSETTCDKSDKRDPDRDALLLTAYDSALIAANRHAVDCWALIHRRRAGVEACIAQLTSLDGKWVAMHAHLPGGDPTAHSDYVRTVFDKEIFSAVELQAQLQASIVAFLYELAAIDHRLAEEFDIELAADPDWIAPLLGQAGQLRSGLAQAGSLHAGEAAGRLALTELATVMATRVILRLGVSCGLLAAGVANSWWSFGASLAVGLLADVIWSELDDPEAELAATLDARLVDFAALLRQSVEAELRSHIHRRQVDWAAWRDSTGNG